MNICNYNSDIVNASDTTFFADSSMFIFSSLLIKDRIFWIYFIIILFFIIIGSSFIIKYNSPNMFIILLFWIRSNVLLMLIVYYISIIFGPRDNSNSIICVVDADCYLLTPSNKIWVLANLLFIILSIISIFWAYSLSDTNNDSSGQLSGVFILLGGLILSSFIFPISNSYIFPFWLSVFYLIIWLFLSIYFIIN